MIKKKPKRWGWQGRQLLGDAGCPYVERWAFYFGPLGSLRLHHWIGSDDLRAKHDHPSSFFTLVLKGRYQDRGRHSAEEMIPGKLRFRKAEYQHSVYLREGEDCWTLLWFFPPRRRWGFWLPKKKCDNCGNERSAWKWDCSICLARLPLKWVKANKYFLENGDHPCE